MTNPLLKEICDYIDTNTSLTVGTYLFAGAAPSGIADTHVIVIESGGSPDQYLADYQEKTIQVLSKSADYFDALANAEVVYAALHCKRGITLGSFYANVIEAITLPQSVGQDEKGLFVLSTNYVLRAQDA
ncbi:MAG: minor capsid protein [Synergistaceae bacterium]|jgi:hypothetical protein